MFYYNSSPSLRLYHTQFGEQMARLGDLQIKPPAEEIPVLHVLTKDTPQNVVEVKTKLKSTTGKDYDETTVSRMLDDLVSRWLVERTEVK